MKFLIILAILTSINVSASLYAEETKLNSSTESSMLTENLQTYGNHEMISTSETNSLPSQPITITGKVTDSNTGEPLPGVNILVKGTTFGTITTSNGTYSINVSGRDEILVFSFVGMTTQEIMVGDKTIIDIVMIEDRIGMDEVVVVGYGTQRKINLTGAIDVVAGETLASRPAAQTGQLLQGQTPSMLVTATARGNEPGASQKFQIRGVGSITGDSSPLVLVDGVEMDMNLVDPQTIESVTILKDASASAVYGSRAAFGVILIQTKKGMSNQPMRVTYSNITSVNVPYYVPDMLDSWTYATVFNQARANSGLSPTFGPAQMERIRGYLDGTYPHEYNPDQPPYSQWRGRWDGNANYNWIKMYFRDYSVQQKHNINLEGGDDKTQYYASVGIQDQPGIYAWGNDLYKRYNVLGNVKTRVTDWADFNFSARFAKTETDYPNGGVWGDRSGFWMHFNILWPTMPRYNMDGTLANPIEVALRDGGRIVTDNNNAQFSVGTELEPVKGWTTNIKYNYSYTTAVSTNHMFPVVTQIPNGTTGNIGQSRTGIKEELRTTMYSVLTAYTKYEKSIANHYLSAMAGFEQDYSYSRNLTGEGYDLITKDLPSISTSLGTKVVDDAIFHWATQGVFGRFNYNYNEKYLLELSARYDGSSRFEDGQRWGFFPSASVGYNVSREAFWAPIEPYVNRLKLRASYGSLGNQSIRGPERIRYGQHWEDVYDPNVTNYLYLEEVPISQNLGRLIDGVRPNYADMPRIRAEQLTWETVITTNLGVEAGFLNNRLTMEFDWYSRITDNMIGPSIQLPSVLGTSAPQSNNAKLKTIGYELVMEWRDRIKDISYNVKLGLGDYQTTILEYVNETGNVNTWYAGKRYGDVWGLTTDKLIQEAGEDMPDQSYYYSKWGPGDVKYVDLSGDGKIDPGLRTLDDHGDLSIITNTSPRYQISFSGGISWKSWDFSMFWQGIGRNNFIPGSGTEFWWGHVANPNSAILLKNSHHTDYWRPADETNFLGPNTDSYMPKPYMSNERNKNLQTQTRFIENAAYLRLKNLQVGYTLPQRIAGKTPIHGARIYFSGENLLTFSPLAKAFEPEGMIASGANMRIYPISQMFSLGINLTF